MYCTRSVLALRALTVAAGREQLQCALTTYHTLLTSHYSPHGARLILLSHIWRSAFIV